ncbi:hypothetical protein VNO78_24063 [Psophocarpus tetragonolobus]|uniref:DUF4378 domain-containing protein n=1 Tax=Psophocarpus tetragonolobus TaxID=3891 RepID=A0AAN9S5B8_PSOTE
MASTLCNHTANHNYASKRSVLLKDYLREDLSSCSSNGFKSLPRRGCCTTVGFLVEKDLKLKRKRRKSLSIWVLQRASGAVIKAIKALPVSAKSDKVSRSLLRKLLSRRFWRKGAREEGSKVVGRRRRSFGELIMVDQEHYKATSHAPSTTTSSGSDSWGDSEFTFASTGASSESSNENYVAAGEGNKEDANHPQEYWSNEKEQFSPASILGCPFEDDEDIHRSHVSSSSTTSTVLSFKEAKHKRMQKNRHFESMVLLEPAVLEERFSRLELEDEPPHSHSTQQCSFALLPIMRTQNDNHQYNHNIEENARDLLNFVRSSILSNSLMIKSENLLFDFFKQSIGENKDIDYTKKLHLCKVAEDWIQAQPQELYLSWEVQGGRCIYVKEMDKYGEWKNSAEEIQHWAMELANEVFSNLVNEFILDLTSHDTC